MMERKDVIFRVIINLYPAIVNWLISKGVIVKNNGSLRLYSKTHNEEDIPKYRICETNDNISTIVCSNYDLKRFDKLACITTYYPKIFKDLNHVVYKPSQEMVSNKYFCSVSDLNILLKNHYNKINEVRLPKGVLISKELRPYYLNIIKTEFNKIKDASSSQITCDWYNGDECKWMSDERINQYIKKHEMYSYQPIYSEMIWDFKFVEKNKELIDFNKLIEKSNLEWTEELLRKYDVKVPIGYFRDRGYSKIKFLSNSYLKEYKEELDWAQLVRFCNFSWTVEDLTSFYTEINRRETPQPCHLCFSVEDLVCNNRIKLTSDLLMKAIELEPIASLEACIKYRFLAKLLTQIPNYKCIVENYDNRTDYWLALADGRWCKYNTYSEKFTIDNIIVYCEDWNKIVETNYEGINRTPDTNYRCYGTKTKWDYFIDNPAIKLSYDMCKILKKLTIKIGGGYITDEVGYVEESQDPCSINALEAFSQHKIINKCEIKKICKDYELLTSFVKLKNADIMDYLCSIIFKEYPIEEYLAIPTVFKNLKEF